MELMSKFRRVKNALANASDLRQAFEMQALMMGRLLVNSVSKSDQTRTLSDAEFQVFSQWGDDGIIQWLINQIEFPNQTFIEFGVANYRESTTRFLMMNDNWSGLVMDGSEANISEIKSSEYYWKYDLTAKHLFVSKDNINEAISDAGFGGELGILHIDLDGNDYWIWEVLDVVRPAMVIVEFNSRFGPVRPITVPYRSDFVRQQAHYSNLYYGASLAAFNALATNKGLSFIGCNSAGVNAFFVRDDLLSPTVKAVGVEEGFVEGKFRESVNRQGQLTYLRREEELDLIRGLPVFNVCSGDIEEF